MTPQDPWQQFQERLEQHDLYRRVWLSTWFVGPLRRQPEILAQLWNGSRGALDDVGWRWCEYRISNRKTFPGFFYALYGNQIDSMPTAPMLVLRAPCRHCRSSGFFVTCNLSRADREARGTPSGRCASCCRTAAVQSVRRWRQRRAANQE